MHNVLLADGGRIQEATIRNSVIGLRSIIGHGVNIQRTILMGADYYEGEEQRQQNKRMKRPSIGIGPNCFIEGAIIDKDARIGAGVVIREKADRPDEEHDSWVSREGIVIVPKNAVVPDGTVI